SDQGPGIPPSDRSRVFERFSRLDAARAADAGGSGLGLAIVKEIVELHRGAIHIADGPGCRMVINLPDRQATPHPLPPPRHPLPPWPFPATPCRRKEHLPRPRNPLPPHLRPRRRTRTTRPRYLRPSHPPSPPRQLPTPTKPLPLTPHPPRFPLFRRRGFLLRGR